MTEHDGFADIPVADIAVRDNRSISVVIFISSPKRKKERGG